MMLLADWKRVILRAWSVRLALLSALLSAAEIGIQVMAVVRPTPWFALAAAGTSLAAAVARVVAQPHLAARPTEELHEAMREARGLLPSPGQAMERDVHARLNRLLVP